MSRSVLSGCDGISVPAFSSLEIGKSVPSNMGKWGILGRFGQVLVRQKSQISFQNPSCEFRIHLSISEICSSSGKTSRPSIQNTSIVTYSIRIQHGTTSQPIPIHQAGALGHIGCQRPQPLPRRRASQQLGTWTVKSRAPWVALLVVEPPLWKIRVSWDDTSQQMEKKQIDVPKHQAVASWFLSYVLCPCLKHVANRTLQPLHDQDPDTSNNLAKSTDSDLAQLFRDISKSARGSGRGCYLHADDSVGETCWHFFQCSSIDLHRWLIPYSGRNFKPLFRQQRISSTAIHWSSKSIIISINWDWWETSHQKAITTTINKASSQQCLSLLGLPKLMGLFTEPRLDCCKANPWSFGPPPICPAHHVPF